MGGPVFCYVLRLVGAQKYDIMTTLAALKRQRIIAAAYAETNSINGVEADECR
jgi:hypothetical protein